MQQTFNARTFLATCTQRPGVYRMQDADGKLLYVGKAINLKKRLASYFRSSGLAPKTAALVARIAHIDTTITNNETEALLLEQNLIKQWRPPYNILLRDDKSYPYIYLSEGDYPGLFLHRGPKRQPGRYFGPYPNSNAVRESLSLLQKTFQVRQCQDSYFRHRTRPCLQYQIQRCKGPCIGLVRPEDYAQDVRHSILFLEGHSNRLTDELSQQMETLAAELAFEEAARIRDQLALLRQLQHSQDMESQSEHADIAALSLNAGGACINLISVRGGRVLGDRNLFPNPGCEDNPDNLLLGCLEQYYLSSTERDLPEQLILANNHPGLGALQAALQQVHQHRLSVSHHPRGIRARWLQLAQTNAEQALASRLHSHQQLSTRFNALAEVLHLSVPLQRLECFDISHSQGEATVASCVAFTPEGPLKSDYRCYNIDSITPGDDYAAMQQALKKRFGHTKGPDPRYPDILLIDGGKGQLNAARESLQALGLSLRLLAVAKGVTRKPGFETLYLDDSQQEFTLPADAPALHLIQQIRDEAHRFAITGNRQRVQRARRTSSLEGIPGIGPTRRRELLRYFGGLQALKNASIDDITRVPGISHRLAEAIHAALHSE